MTSHSADHSGERSWSDQWRYLGVLRGHSRPYWGWLVLAFAIALIGSGLGLVYPFLVGELVNAAADGNLGSVLSTFVLALAGVFVAQALLSVMRAVVMSRVGQGVVRSLRSALFSKLLRLPVSFFDRQATGEVTSRLMSDAGAIHSSTTGAAPAVAASLVTTVGATVLLFVISPVLAVAIVAIIPVAGVLAYSFGKKVRRLSRRYQDLTARSNALAVESISEVRVIKLFGAEADVNERYWQATGEVVEVGQRRARVRAVWSAGMGLVFSLTLIVVVWWGGRLVESGSLSAGDLVAFLLYGALVTRGSVGLVNRWSTLQSGLGSAERVFELLEEPSESDDDALAVQDHPPSATPVERVLGSQSSAGTRPPSPSIRFANVTFTYPGRNEPALDDVTVDIEGGSTIALVGASGAGKSTMVQLLARFYQPDHGHILIDGVPIGGLPLAQVRSLMATVPQEVNLLSGTVRDNIRLGWPAASDADVQAAATAAHVWEFVDDLPRSLDTRVGERGVSLSGGQRQRIALARAFLADPSILLLDEATNALDSASELAVQSALEELMHDRTCVVIAHRLSTVQRADAVAVLDRGRVVEFGPPAALLSSEGSYAQLWALQHGEHQPG